MAVVFAERASLPIATFPSPVVLYLSDLNPNALFLFDVLRERAPVPTATLNLPSVLTFNAELPIAILSYSKTANSPPLTLPKVVQERTPDPLVVNT